MRKEHERTDNQPDELTSDWEEHRAFVRDIDKRFSTLYGGCGSLILIGFFVSLIGFAYFFWDWLSPAPWVLSLTMAIIGIFILRYFVHIYADFLYDEIDEYCQEHALSISTLREAFDEEGRLEYFHSVFEVRERRQGLEQ